jgi:hypothetical protein
MFKWWVRLLPFFVVRWLARRKCPLQPIGPDYYGTLPFDDTLMVFSENNNFGRSDFVHRDCIQCNRRASTCPECERCEDHCLCDAP